MKKSSAEDWDFDSLEYIAAIYAAENSARNFITEAAVDNLCQSTGIQCNEHFISWYERSANTLASDIIEEIRSRSNIKTRIEILSRAASDPSRVIQDYVSENLHESEWLYGDKWQSTFAGLRTILSKFYGPELDRPITLQETENLLRECRNHFTALSQAEIRFAAKRGRKKSRPLSRAMGQLCRMADLYGLDLILPANEVAGIKEASTPLFRLALSFIGHASFKLSIAIEDNVFTSAADNIALQKKAAWLNHFSPRTLVAYLREEIRVVQAQNSVLQVYQLPPHGASEIRAFNPSDGIPSEEIQPCSKPEPSGSTRSPNTPR